MRLPIPAPQPAAVLRRTAMVFAALLAVLLAGCATQSEYYGAQMAMEDDGLPAQIPPLRRAKPEQDDPSEPFSPNYGPPLPKTQTTINQPDVPEDLPPAFRRKLIRAVSIS